MEINYKELLERIKKGVEEITPLHLSIVELNLNQCLTTYKLDPFMKNVIPCVGGLFTPKKKKIVNFYTAVIAELSKGNRPFADTKLVLYKMTGAIMEDFSLFREACE